MEKIIEELNLSKEDIEFLLSLRKELNTQDHDYQASPRFWVVKQQKTRMVPKGFGDREIIIDKESGYNFESEKEFKEFLISEYDYKPEDLAEIEYLSDLAEFADELGERFEIMDVIDTDEICENTFFLTKKECAKHIEENLHHYNKPHTYAMTAWRSPEVKRLWQILHGTEELN